ncbi:phosphoribosylformylglycinamidine synthase [Helicobacter pametensis]|nr:phosphoribosylformylglycinamidine synthase [Helicobacter pametensis]
MHKFYVQKRKGFDFEAQHLLEELREILSLPHLRQIAIINQYRIDDISPQDLIKAQEIVLSEPQVDEVLNELAFDDCDAYFAIQIQEGQFDPRSDSAKQCLQMLLGKDLNIKHTKIFKLYGHITAQEREKILSYLINPLETQEVQLDSSHQKTPLQTPSTLTSPPNLDDFLELEDFKPLIQAHRLSLDVDDLLLIQKHYKNQKKTPNLLELKIIDTYWSDHCRHTTFFTHITEVSFEDSLAQKIYGDYLQIREELQWKKPITLMDLSTIMSSYLKPKLSSLVQGEENNACTLSIQVKTPQGDKPYYLFFKNETHNHPTEIEPFGGASTCIGGAIRDPLSARGYVYAGMRISGSANPLEPIEQTREGKLAQRKIALSSSDGFSSYGNQIGVATGMVEEFYHEGYKAKHLELGAVLGAAPQENIITQTPKKGDIILLIGGETGRDGCGGATGSSQSHHIDSLKLCGAEVQKGNAPQERKIQRFFRNKEVTRLIKRCNDFGAGGVSIAIPELAESVEIDLDKIPCKYEGLSVFDLALSESQERMAVLIAPEHLERFQTLADAEKLQSTPIARVSDDGYVRMKYFDEVVVCISRELLASNGATKFAKAHIAKPKTPKSRSFDFIQDYQNLAQDLNVCSQKGLVEKFDSTIGGNTIFMPLGGKYQATPIQAMAHKIPFEETTTCSIASYGMNPFLCEQDPCRGGYLAVVESVCKLIASGAKFEEIYLSFQEYFESLKQDEGKWGKPLAALLGAFLAQKRLGICAIGGKDSMSGSFEELSVPPTFVSFAFSSSDSSLLISPEFKAPNHFVYWIKPRLDEFGLPCDLEEIFHPLSKLIEQKKIISAYTPTYGGVAEAVMKMCLGNRIGFEFADHIKNEEIFTQCYGSFIVEATQELDIGIKLGCTTMISQIALGSQKLSLMELLRLYEQPLESVYKTQISQPIQCPPIPPHSHPILQANLKYAKPRVVIPVFFGTNCEYDTQRAFEKAGAEVETLVIATDSGFKESLHNMQQALKNAQILFLAGGFSGGDEPDGSAKMIKTFFSNPLIQDTLSTFLHHQDGLIGGICNGFQALIKLGLLPFGQVTPSLPSHPTLLHNAILRHQSKIVNIKVCSNSSPWLSQTQIGEIYSVPISHGEGRFYAQQEILEELIQNGQIATQYVDFEGNPSGHIDFNPNGSIYAIEGITSKDGRVFGKMGHTERVGKNLYKNITGNFEMRIFEGAVGYFG